MSSTQHPELLNVLQKFACIKLGSGSFCCFVGAEPAAAVPSAGAETEPPRRAPGSGAEAGALAGPGAAAAGLPRGLDRVWLNIRRAPGIQECAGCWPLPGFCVLRKSSVHLHLSKCRKGAALCPFFFPPHPSVLLKI